MARPLVGNHRAHDFATAVLGKCHGCPWYCHGIAMTFPCHCRHTPWQWPREAPCCPRQYPVKIKKKSVVRRHRQRTSTLVFDHAGTMVHAVASAMASPCRRQSVWPWRFATAVACHGNSMVARCNAMECHTNTKQSRSLLIWRRCLIPLSSVRHTCDAPVIVSGTPTSLHMGVVAAFYKRVVVCVLCQTL